MVSHNGSNYGYHFIIEELAEQFKRKFNSFGEKTFSILIEKNVKRIDKNGEQITKNYILQTVITVISVVLNTHNLKMV